MHYVSLSFSKFSPFKHAQTHVLFGLFVPHCANKTLNPALKLNLGPLLCAAAADAGNPVKSVMLIIITEAPWRLEDAIHHIPPVCFSSWPFSPCRPKWLSKEQLLVPCLRVPMYV